MSNTGRRVFGTLNTVVAALALWGGANEVRAYWGREALPVAVGLFGVAAGLLLGLSGLALWRNHRAARGLALAAGTASILVHGTGVLLGIIGYAAVVVAVLYPAVMMAWARGHLPPARPASSTESGQEREKGETTETRLRVAAAPSA